MCGCYVTARLAIVIPTKDRPQEVRRLLESIRAQPVYPTQVVIVDAGDRSLLSILGEFPELEICHIRADRPGLTRQKNIGFCNVDPRTELIAFIDDDIVLEPGALPAMLAYWEQAAPFVGGASFNNVKSPWLLSRPVRLYLWLFLMDSGEYGVVLRSGFNTPIANAPETRFVEWLNGGCTIWRREVFQEHRFDEWFPGNGLCEDLRFSRQVGRRFRLVVVADARVQHQEAPRTMQGDYFQGIAQVVNRFYVVQCDEGLSRALCMWALWGLFLHNLTLGFIKRDKGLLARAQGNCVGFVRLLMGCLGRIGSIFK